MNKVLKFSIFFWIALLGSNQSFSQTLVWEKVTGFSNSVDYCEASAPLGKSRYLFGGHSRKQNNNLRIPLLIFTNTVGDTLFTKNYRQFDDGEILTIATEEDSTIIVAGDYKVNNQRRTFMFKADYNGNISWHKEVLLTPLGNSASLEILPDGYLLFGQGDAILLKVDKQGNVIWQKTLPANVGGGSVKLMKDGSYIACGNTNLKSSTSLSSYHKTNPMLIQIRPNGDTIRTKIIGSFQNHDLIHEAKQTADGGVIVIGRYVLNSNPTKMQGLVIKFDSAWNQQWWYTIMPPRGDYDHGCELFNVHQLADSSYIVSGIYHDIYQTSPIGDRNGYVANIAKDGSAITWQQQYRGGSDEWFTNMFYLNDGSAVFSGTKNLYPNFDFYLVKLKSLGLPYIPNFCQQKPLPQLSVQVITNDTIAFTSSSLPGTRYGTISTYFWRFGDGATSTKANPKHKYNMPLSQLQNMPVTLIVTNNSGCTDSVTTYPFLRVSASDAMPGLQVQLYPNPTSGKTTFSISGYTDKEAVTVALMDVLGRKVNIPVKQSKTAETQQLEVNTSTLPAGLYLYQLYSGNQMVSSGKLVKE